VTFLSPWAAITAAALAVPALLFLYFLKLRRFPVRIPSTLLWRKSVEDLQVNAPFQRLRITLLLLLQLFILACFILALGQPVIRGQFRAGDRLIVIIDRSASMNARDDDSAAGRTRLERAKESALDLVDRLGSAENPAEAMVIAFAGSPAVIHPFDGDRRSLRDAIRGIEPTEEPGDLGRALELADAYAVRRDEDEPAPIVAIMSDGGVEPPNGETRGRFRVRAGEVRFIQIVPGATAGNLGIVSMSARRRFDDPARVDLFIRAVNSGPLPIETSVTVRVDDRVDAVRTLTIPPAEEEGAPGEATESFDLEMAGGALITASLGFRDALATDDVASVLMPAPRPPAILVVARDGAPDPFVLNLLETAEPGALDVRSPASYEQGAATGEAPGAYDLIVFDRAAPTRLPRVACLFFGALPPGVVPADAESEPQAMRIASWNRAHPLMRHVELDDIVVEGFAAFALPDNMTSQAVELASTRRGPVVGAIESGDVLHVFAGFELMRSNWPADISLLIFFQNVLDHALGPRAGAESISFRTGEAARVAVDPSADQLVVSGPVDSALDVAGRDRLVLPAFRMAGVYSVQGAQEPLGRIAVNLASSAESDLRPRPGLVINADSVDAEDADSVAARELWPWLVAAAFLLLLLEWVVYTIKARG
jgi:hypothetical protein